MAYAAYVAEEVFESSAEHQIGSDCVGTRDGLRGGKRCTLGEFIDHVWKGMTDTDKKPTGITGWDKVEDQLKNGNMGVEDMIRKIMRGIQRDDPKGPDEKGKLNKVQMGRIGFTGKADGKKIFPGMTPVEDGMVNYYTAMEKCGDRLVAAKEGFDKYESRLSDDVKSKFNNWLDKGKTGAEVLHDLRLVDKWQAMYLPGKGNLDAKMNLPNGGKTARTLGTTENNFKIIRDKGEWFIMDLAATVQMYNGATLADKEAAFDTNWNAIKSSAKFDGHETALESVNKLRAQMKGC